MSSLTVYLGGASPDTLTLQQRIDAAAAGSILNLLPWSYTAGATVNKPLTILGGLVTPAANTPGLTITADNVSIHGMTLTGPQHQDYTGHVYEDGIYVNTSISGLTIRNCRISNFGDCGMWLNGITSFLLDGNDISDINYAAIMVLSAVNGTISNNTIARVGESNQEGGVRGALDNNCYGIAVTDISGVRSSDVLVSGNTISKIINWEAMDTHGGLRITFSGNTVTACRRGVMLTYTAGNVANDCIVDGNEFLSPETYPAGDQYATVLVNSDNAHVTNNTITGWGTPETTRAYLRVTDTNTTISGNTVTP